MTARCSIPAILLHPPALVLLLLALIGSGFGTDRSAEVNRAPLPPGRSQRLASPDAVPDGLSAGDWSSVRQQYEQQRHRAVAVDGGHQARNPGQQWLTRFDGRGFLTRPDAGGWQWGLELQSYGFTGHERTLTAPPQVSAAGQRVVYEWDTTLQEWFVNDRRGLEHGFTLKDRPAGAPALNSQPPVLRSLGEGGSTLNLLLAVRGGLRPEVEADGRGVRFVDAQGAAAVTYGGLTVRDADGRNVPARFEPVFGRASVPASPNMPENQGSRGRSPSHLLRLAIDERGARYPLTIDPIAQQAYLKASNTEANDYFGRSVAVSGDTVVVGAYNEDSAATGVNGNQGDNSADQAGAAYVFVRSGTSWSQQAYLKASNTGAYDEFGISVAVSGDTVVVGAYGEASAATGVNGNQGDNSATSAGAAYVFTRWVVEWPPRLTIVPDGSGGYFIRFTAFGGETCRLQRASSLNGSWSTSAPQTVPPSGLMEFHDTFPPPDRAFYRVSFGN